MTMFHQASSHSRSEVPDRKITLQSLCSFGIAYLDDFLSGILRNDLILVGAPSGVGKTQLCCNIAVANLESGKRVHYIALEAEHLEIERRLKYQIFANHFFSNPSRPRIAMRYDVWRLGKYIDECYESEEFASQYFEAGFKNLSVMYKQAAFGIPQLIEAVISCSDQTDLIIIDHVHYFDFEDDNENRALKQIASTVRDLVLNEGKPIVLVSHLRKRDRFNQSLVADLDEFHGSSDLYKIATKTFTIAPGGVTDDGKYETFFRTAKNRINGGVTRYIGRCLFDPKKGSYEDEYKVGWANQARDPGFEELDHHLYPDWARRPGGIGRGRDYIPETKPASAPNQDGARIIPNYAPKGDGVGMARGGLPYSDE